ncbi:MAG: VWA domain-containing protein [Thermoplasmatota archaeon]
MSEDQEVPYPHIRGEGVVLPDCSKGVYAPFRLTASEKRELIREVAQKGLRGIDDFLSRPPQGGSVAERMAEIRKRISEQLEQVQTRRRGALESEIKRLMRRGQALREGVEEGYIDDDSAFRRFSSEEIRGEILGSDLIGILEGRIGTADQTKKTCFLMRLLGTVRRFLLWLISRLLSVLGRLKTFFRRVFTTDGERRRRSKKKGKGAIVLPFPSLSMDLDRWRSQMDKRIDEDEHLQKAVNRRLSDRYGYDSGVIELRRSYDPEWYREQARKVLEEEVKETADRKMEEIERMRRRDSRELSRRMEEERKIREELMRAERELGSGMDEALKEADRMTAERMRTELLETLAFMGFVRRTEGVDRLEEASVQWEITEALVEKFSEFIFAELMERSAGMRDRRGRQISDAGVYEKARMRTIAEEPRMDILQTLVNSRVNHPGDPSIEPFDVVVHREITTSELHCVILVDVSGSMEENMRLEAAKRSVLALSQAVKRENPRNKVDMISVSTRAKPVTLKEVMSLEPHGFTNHQEGFALARAILEGSRSDRHMIFLITDGLPEAYTDVSGEPVAGDLVMSMDLALAEVNALKRIPDLHFEMFLLEPEDERFISAAKRIARAGDGNVIVADPQELAYKVIGEFMSTGRPLEGI